MRILLTFFLTLLLSGLYAQINFTDSIQVRLKELDGQKQGNQHVLNWTVACQLDFARFDIQRSTDGTHYSSVHQFEADQLRCLDPFQLLLPATNYKSFYRIRVGDLDGKFYSSKTIVIYASEEEFDIASITPSVVNQRTVVTISASSADKVKLQVNSSQGWIASQQVITLQKGANQIDLDLMALTPGIYYLTVTNTKGIRKSMSLVKQ